ncbi:endonuclease/exonuclease/phosphatase family protein [Algoriphagus sp. AGSA1]|uniref:endonuclease/exonuclease/phosphatase family protein n=1 Tax=Algoriphagus sp. AGSA1 TaxID=2907213 RepID=UPI001F29345D|nr:endonuclease/exonuclease/phosphatase family protein [Algoriphagus sp. AGSA1]MCE7057343.1 endonuclease/exonuclease/phosphatase family protein [Algoriphagus sp. AGSA1]
MKIIRDLKIYIPLFILFQCCSITTASAQKEPAELKVMSFNIRMNYADDGSNNWEHRKEWIADMVNHYSPDMIGIQEGHYPQYIDMVDMLSEYESIGPKEGWQGAESVAIFYRKGHFKLLDSATFWLSETPEMQGPGWDAELRRTAVWGAFQEKTSKRKFFFFSTHFDHKGDIARTESTILLKSKVKEIAGTLPAIIVGDFNLRPESPYYSLLTKGDDNLPAFFDAYIRARHTYGPGWTVNSFGGVPVEKRGKIDYIFSNQPLPVSHYINICEQRGEVFLSDHNPQLATFIVD